MHKITRHVLTPDGGSFNSRDEDFLVAESLDFHPTDVLEDADGSLVVIDTGGWYKLCCPTSQLHKPDVLGAIYRIKRTDSPTVSDPRGQRLAWKSFQPEDLARLLSDARSAVRQRAMSKLAKRGKEAIPVMAEVVKHSPSAERRRNAVWTLTRIENQDSASIVRSALNDGDESVRQVSLHSVSLLRDREALPRLIEMLSNETLPPHNRRVAAEAIGRIGDRSAVTALLAAAGKPHDRAARTCLDLRPDRNPGAEGDGKGIDQ